MHDSGAMRLVECVRNLNSDLQRLLNLGGSSGDLLRERLALQVLHDEVVRPILMPYVVERADVGMRERRDGARLAVEAFAEVWIGGYGSSEDLEGDTSVKSCIAGFVNLAHAPTAKVRDDLVGAEPGARRQGQLEGTERIIPRECRALPR